jgi:hypothetical protein
MAMFFRMIPKCILFAILALSPLASGPFLHAEPPRGPDTADKLDPVAAKADYLRKLGEYEDARQKFEAIAQPYWDSIAEKRKNRAAKRRNGEPIALPDYVLEQPPLYQGPARPVDPYPEDQQTPAPAQKPIPVVADLLRSVAAEYGFVPDKPKAEIDFKRAYARFAASVGISKQQAVRIYGFESGGNGKYDVQAGLEYETPGAHAVSTALGYNQLLNTNSVELLAEQGDRFLELLCAKSKTLIGDAKTAFDAKVEIVKAMIVFSRTVPDDWSEHERLAETPKGLAIHSLNLDIDVGPMLQTQKLLDSVLFAKRRGRTQPLTAAELEMMNLTGDGNGFDMISLPDDMRPNVPTSNFFQRSGYERNGIAIRNNTVEKLILATDGKMDKETQLQGAKDLAASFPN